MKPLVLDTLKSAAWGLSVTFFILIVVVAFKPNTFSLIALLLTINLTRAVYKAFKKGWKVAPTWGRNLIKSTTTLTIFATIIIWLAKITGAWGFLSLLLIVLTISAYILWMKRKTFMFWIYEIERQLYGETLEERRERKNGTRPK